MKKIISLFFIILLVLAGCSKLSLESKRENILTELNIAVKEAKEQGKYGCCIEPPCTMCYLGDWIWDDGSCDCDNMMKEGNWDKVCSQCERGIKEGRCESTQKEVCDLEI